MQTQLLRSLLFAAVLPVAAEAQHNSARALLDPPRSSERLRCRAIAPPNPTLPPSVQSFEFTYQVVQLTAAMDTVFLVPHQRLTVVWDSAGRLVLIGSGHEPTPTDSLTAGFVMVASVSTPFAGQWITLDGTVRGSPMSAEELKAAEELASFVWMRRCPGAAPSRRAP